LNISNPKIWSLTDGSQGMISQTKGLAFEFSNNITEIKTEIIFPWSWLQPGFLPIYSWIFKNKIPNNEIPDIIISCGRKSVYLSMYLKKKYSKLINIHIQNPKVSSNNFSFIVAPNHDNFKGKNIINSIGAIHPFKNGGFAKNKINIDSSNLVSCIIGGENNHYLFSLKETNDLCNKIIKLKEKNPKLKFLIITSRRTNYEIKNILKNKLGLIAEIWLGDGKNPYEFALYNSKFFIITSDSTSMISEASISGMPIYIYQLPFKRKSIRFNRFHDEFRRLNITRDLISANTLENWSYDKIDESKRISGIIKERIIEVINESK
tara:strand:+ start:660 stop:1622 length:963 start_codon:yes stop_codon:yes gene_type:complete